jgi:hypothetical protein
MENIEEIDKLFENIESKDDKIRYAAFQELLRITETPVTWVYDKWFVLTGKLASGNSYQRSIGLLLLANLCKSDTENRFGEILGLYFSFFEDEKFITARQCIQNVWKIAIVNGSYQKKVIGQLESSYSENKHLSPHGNLIKQDIISSLLQIYKHSHDESVRDKMQELIGAETDAKLQKTLSKLVVS